MFRTVSTKYRLNPMFKSWKTFYLDKGKFRLMLPTEITENNKPKIQYLFVD